MRLFILLNKLVIGTLNEFPFYWLTHKPDMMGCHIIWKCSGRIYYRKMVITVEFANAEGMWWHLLRNILAEKRDKCWLDSVFAKENLWDRKNPYIIKDEIFKHSFNQNSYPNSYIAGAAISFYSVKSLATKRRKILNLLLANTVHSTIWMIKWMKI